MSEQCKQCDEQDDFTDYIPCCEYGSCEVPTSDKLNESTISNCIHCGGELRRKGDRWYHYSQFEADVLGPPQDYNY